MTQRDAIQNRDLLVDAETRESLAVLYAPIAFALDFPELREVFAPIDRKANRAKARSGAWGATAVTLGAFSLFAGMAQPVLLEQHISKDLERALALAIAASGILSLFIGLFGVLYAGGKRAWMRNRYITERMRQFHFQAMIGLLPQLVSDPVAYQSQRSAQFAAFQQAHVIRAKAQLTALLEDEPGGERRFFPEPSVVSVPADDHRYQAFVAAYSDLRVQHQIDFCNLKLMHRGLFSNYPRDQLALFSALAGLTVLGALGTHAAAAIGVVSSSPWLDTPLLHLAGLWCAAGALVVRTLEEGYRPQREVERYRQYRSALISMRERLAQAQTPSETIAAMWQVEASAFEEMVNFLKAYKEAKFVM